MTCSFRKLEATDQAIVRRFLYHAIFLPAETKPPPESIVDHQNLIRYWRSWGGRHDLGFGAFMGSTPIGIAWSRLFPDDAPGYGFVDRTTPELSMAVLAAYRNRGIGGRLLELLVQELRATGCKALSLSVNKRNPAIRLYQRFGFETIAAPGDDYTMLLQLQAKRPLP